jgi:outer membrane protein assembly factor BamA
MITDAEQAQVQQKIADYYAARGYPDAQINIDQKVIQKTKLYLIINIQKGKRVKVASILFKGNVKVKNRKLKKLLSIDTKSKWFAKSLLNEELLQSGKLIIQHCSS